MKHKHIFMTLLATLAIALFVGACSENSPTEPVINSVESIELDSINAEMQAEQEAFSKALINGVYRFSVDENGDLILYDGVNVPEGEEDLYESFLKLSGNLSVKQAIGTKATSLPSTWRYACWREACYALSRTKYLQGRPGQSRRSYYWNRGWWLAGDWNYDGLGYGRGGQCKHFARRIVQRATGYRYNLPSGYNYAYGDISWCRPGDVIQRSDRYGIPHTAIVFAILSRDGSGRVTRIDVIDANFVNYPHEMIARHYLPYGSNSLSQYKVW